MEIEIIKKSYNWGKIIGVFNLLMGMLMLLVAHKNNASLTLPAVAVIFGGIGITISRGPFIRRIKIIMSFNPKK